MTEMLMHWSPRDVIGLVATTLGLLIPITAIVAAQWRGYLVKKMELALKQDMVQRGMSAEEIERVLKASQKGS